MELLSKLVKDFEIIWILDPKIGSMPYYSDPELIYCTSLTDRRT